ncbi:HAD-IIIA family hydrolase [Pandoraea nosoerga]|uniref:D,D-heptose 1,7-bisphosphate phosphatase n=1 Tax=Pandoraea nosoerga TaxID=2508296 RepID=A0A5E4SLS3_9BURK|nr:HAD-IIIA family hydrolase [Pandoraea nosoerga]MBN4665222.1 HAD-IIIA family hydrolase [Pandoraea nosoerga]MBN4674623.1 HAD-IIIA family hydrolase [Pandoraea nosoerga]MBN4680511.1 HAD-IIIA family hydrolase [Pandoraea nosoerga]MBN4743916.1 HAD-IIIA family hydrolase [Pandoraea nosoerga]VVD76650.1 HAD family hydrolase [Pandoraea nosoerga]
MAVIAGEHTPEGAILIDKDGTLIDDDPFNVEPARIRLAPGAEQALCEFASLRWPVAIVSNQPGVAFGYFAESELNGVREHLARVMADYGVDFAGFFYCPHHPQGRDAAYRTVCACRKPAPGLLQAAARHIGVPLSRCWMIGDILDDVEAGNVAGCQTILVDCGNETQWRTGAHRTPDHTVSAIDQAARLVVSHARETANIAVGRLS